MRNFTFSSLMSKVCIFSLFLLSFVLTGHATPTTIFSENFGTPSSNTPCATYSSGTGTATYQNKATQTYTASATSPDVRTTSPSSTYTGFSASGNVFFTTTNNIYLAISNINTSAYSNISLSLGFLHSTTAVLTQSNFAIEVCTDYVSATNSGTWTALTFSSTSTSTWNLLSPAGSIPSSSTLTIRFTQKQTNQQIRIDDIVLTGTAQATSVTAGTPTNTTIPTVSCTNGTGPVGQYL